MTFSIWIALFVTILYMVIDTLYAIYTISVTKRKAKTAAITAALMYGLLACGVFAYIQNPWYIVFTAIGSYIGTYLTVKFHHYD